MKVDARGLYLLLYSIALRTLSLPPPFAKISGTIPLPKLQMKNMKVNT